jgi:hypothetical protein
MTAMWRVGGRSSAFSAFALAVGDPVGLLGDRSCDLAAAQVGAVGGPPPALSTRTWSHPKRTVSNPPPLAGG